MIDAIASMQHYITKLEQVIESIVDSLTRPNNKESNVLLAIRLACVSYRDNFGGFQVLDFTEKVWKFQIVLKNVIATGSGNGPATVFGALYKTRSLNWSRDSGVKQIFHIVDVQAHVLQFHDTGIPDYYFRAYSSDPSYIELFKWITNTMEINYVFKKINDSTNRMIEVFSTAAGKSLDTFDVKNPALVEAAILTSLAASIDTVVARCKTLAIKSKEREIRQYTIDKSFPDWSAMPILEGRLQSYPIPESINDIIFDKPLNNTETRKSFVKIAPNPFTEGTNRIVYYGLDLTEIEPVPVVFKEFKRLYGEINSANKYELENQMQTISSFMAFEFSKALTIARVTRPVEMKFLEIKTFATKTLNSKWLS